MPNDLHQCRHKISRSSFNSFLPYIHSTLQPLRQPPIMLQSPGAEQQQSDAGLKPFSCLTCRQRKIKCDRNNPCSNCTRGGRPCSFVVPMRGKPSRRKPVREGLHARLRRYEEMLKAYGADIEPSVKENDNNISDGEAVSEPDVEMTEDTKSVVGSVRSHVEFDESKTRLVNNNGSSRYFDKYAI